MKLKLDENLPARLVADLESLGHDVDTVSAEGLGGRPDSDVWTLVQTERRFLVTQDMDFSDTRRYAPGSHAGLLIVRLVRPGREALRAAVHRAFRARGEDDWTGCFVVVSENKLRVLRPSGC